MELIKLFGDEHVPRGHVIDYDHPMVEYEDEEFECCECGSWVGIDESFTYDDETGNSFCCDRCANSYNGYGDDDDE